MYDEIHAGKHSLGTENLINILNNEGVEILNGYAHMKKRFFIDENGELDVSDFETKLATFQRQSITIGEENQYLVLRQRHRP